MNKLSDIFNAIYKKVFVRVTAEERAMWRDALMKHETSKKKYILPDGDFSSDDSFYLKRFKEKASGIQETLYNKLKRDFQETLQSESLLRPKGKTVGTVSPERVQELKERLTATFHAYTVKHPRLGVPLNIATIATTEVNSLVNEAKDRYVTNLIENNPGLKIMKRWIHNPRASKQPRKSHMAIHRAEVDYKKPFAVPTYDKSGNKLKAVVKMARPHDPNAPLDQIINCSCGLQYFIKR